jgi:hypothetical protein
VACHVINLGLVGRFRITWRKLAGIPVVFVKARTNRRCALGDEFYVDLFSEAFHAGTVDILNTGANAIVGTRAISFGPSSL